MEQKPGPYEKRNAICIINTFSKDFEAILHERIYFFVKNSLSAAQHGFMRNKSTITNLSVFSDIVSKTLAENGQTDSVYFDFRNAFDKVDHSLLYLKLLKSNIPLYLTLLLKSYLENRLQFVYLNSVNSFKYRSVSGVPQGSNLGPVLFNVFIDDIVEVVRNSHVLLYADDLKIFKHIKHLNDCLLLQSDIDSIVKWAHANHMKLNSEKCSFVSFFKSFRSCYIDYAIEGFHLNTALQITDMGILFDHCLSFKPHIDMMVKSCFQSLGGVIRVSKNFKNVETIKLLYNGLVRSRLEYGSIIWNPIFKSYSGQVEMVQKRLLRYLYFKKHGCYPHFAKNRVRTRDLESEFDLLSLELRRRVADCIFLFKIVNNMVDCSHLLGKLPFKYHTVSTRNPKTFEVLKFKNNIEKASFVNRSILHFNTFPTDVDPFHYNLRSFKNFLVAFFEKKS